MPDRKLCPLTKNRLFLCKATYSRAGGLAAPIGDVVFSAVTKVFLTKSARRVMSRLKSAHEDGYLERPMTFNTLLGYMAKPELTQVLQELLIKSSLPFRSLETSFAIDSTGVAGNRFVRWTDVKYRGVTEHLWAKVHLMCGVKTHIITAAAIAVRLLLRGLFLSSRTIPRQPDLSSAPRANQLVPWLVRLA